MHHPTVDFVLWQVVVNKWSQEFKSIVGEHTLQVHHVTAALYHNYSQLLETLATCSQFPSCSPPFHTLEGPPALASLLR